MSSGKGVKQLQYQLFNGALFLLLSLQYTCSNAEGNVGCLYSNEPLCDKKTEWCFDDYAFGRCVYKSGYASDDLYRFRFKYEDLEKLKRQLKELKSLGFGWKHPYTQCVIQIQLQTFKIGVPYTLKSCDQILKREFSDLYQYGPRLSADEAAQQVQEGSYKLPQPAINEGVIKYEPDDKDQRLSDAGSYYEQSTDYENELMNQLRLGAETKPRVLKKSTRSRNTPLYLSLQNRQQLENEMMKSKGDVYDEKYGLGVLPAEDDNYEDLRALQKTLDMLEGDRGKTYTEGGPMYILGEKNDYDNSVYDKLWNRYGADEPDIFGFQRSERLDVKKPGPGYGVNDYAFRNLNTKLDTTRNRPESTQDSGVTKELAKKSYRNVNGERLHKEQKSEYEYVPNYGHALRSENLQSPSHYVTIETNNRNLSRPLATKFLGTIRNIRRLPAGTFRNLKVHNDRTIYFSVRTNIINYSANDISRIIGETIAESPIEGFDVTAVYVGLPREIVKTESSTAESVSCDADDSEFALLELSENPDSWKEADTIVRRLNSFFGLPPETLYCIKNSESEIAFKVRNNSKGLNAAKVVDDINTQREAIKKKLDLPIVSVGIRSHDHPTIQRLETDPGSGSLKLAIIIFGVVSAALVSIVTLYAVQRQNKIQEKLHGLARDSDLGRNHHQESFKNRIIGSKPVVETSVSAQRITSLSRESDNSPSSRSSTSSWSEDPMTNMDVTTGHMVLAYMEDHLTNKARLDTEWAALCAYDADPCSVAIAQQPENVRKNRYVNALPYDHARVVLNALSNVNGSDYINASTITDHDPRNPAYIATQGPLENTVYDFWQMLWEQGCNIVVMLTRQIENDTTMSCRYWPSEGVELYNIYEVHLVSEHIWCDDFIVRSFYLKNQKTTETRTITQFHFLAWPEGGIPPSAKSLLEFRRKVNKSFREKNHPIVVHCSDGVGRTGSYLLLDMVLNRIAKGAKEIDIAATLEHIRDQRAGAVCTKQQFQFVLSAVAEEVQAVLKAIPQQQQSAQDQTTDNVAPLVQLSTDSTDQTTETAAQPPAPAPAPAPAPTTALPDSDTK